VVGAVFGVGVVVVVEFRRRRIVGVVVIFDVGVVVAHNLGFDQKRNKKY